MSHLVSPFVMPVPVSVDFPNSKGRAGEFSQIRDLRTVQPYRVAGAVFEGTTLDTNFWTSAVSGAGAANTQASGLVTTASGTANSGYAQVISRKGRFIFAHPMLVRMAVRIPTVVVALNTRRWGAFTTSAPPTPTDGFWFELSAAGVLSVNARNAGGSVTTVASGSFNGEVASYTVDSNVHVYEIHYFVMAQQFYVDGKLLHTFTLNTANLTEIYTLPITWNSANTAAGVTSGTIEMWAANMARMGRDETSPSYVRQSGTTAALVLKYGPGQLHNLAISNVSDTCVLTLYDNTAASGTTIYSTGAMAKTQLPFDVDLHQIQFFIGLTLVIAAAACDVTVIYE